MSKQNQIKRKCPICNKLFSVISARNQAQFCSIECQNVWQRRNKITKICPQCNKAFSRPPSQESTFCSMECYRKSTGLKSWSKEKVIRAIKELNLKSDNLNAAYIRDTNNSLFKAAINNFASWEKAINKACIKYEEVRGDRKLSGYKGIIIENIVEDLFRITETPFIRKPYLNFGKEHCIPDFTLANGKIWVDVKLHSFSAGIDKTIVKYTKYAPKLNILYLLGENREHSNKLVKFINIHEYFPILKKNFSDLIDIKNKIKAIENHYEFFPWELEKISRKWSREKVIKEILHAHKIGHLLNVNQIRIDDNKLLCAAIKYYDSWQKAVEAAGFNYDDLKRKRDRYSKKEILDIILKLNNENADLSFQGLAERKMVSMYNAARNLFGSWAAAVKEAGIDYDKVKRPNPPSMWTLEIIVEEINILKEAGLDLSASNIQKTRPDLYKAAYRRFKSWKKALESAGIDYKGVYKHEDWNKRKIIDEIVELHNSGVKLTQENLKKINRYKLYDAAFRHFGGLRKAIEAANIRN